MAAVTDRLSLAIQGVAARTAAHTTSKPVTRRPKPTSLLVTSGSDLLVVSLATRTTSVLAKGFSHPAGVALDASGRTAYVADLNIGAETYTIVAVPVHKNPKVTKVHSGSGIPGQLAIAGTTLAFVDGPTGKLVTIDLTSGTETVVGTGLGDVGGVAYSDDGKRIHVVESITGRWLSIAPGDASFATEGTGLTAPRNLTSYNPAKTFLVPGHGLVGTVESLAIATQLVKHLFVLGPTDSPIAVWRLATKSLITVDLAGITWWDPTLPYVPPFPVTLSIADPTPFIGSYQRIAVDLGTTGYTMDDLDVTISHGDAGGQFSYSRDDLSAPNEVMLLVGYEPGLHTIDVIHRATATKVGTLDVTTIESWTVPESPAHWLSGPVGDFRTGYTWGGGGTSPQNVDVMPQSGSRGIAILLVDVSDARYPTGAGITTVRDNWRDSAVGNTNSARLFYEEVSHGTFTLGLQGTSLPLASISDNWAGQFDAMPTPWPSNSFAPKDGTAFAQACISNAAAQVDSSNHPLIDFSQVKSVILVVRSAGTAGTDNFFWPQAWGGNFTIPGGSQNMNILGMPDDWQETRDTSRTRTETLCHEMGHNLGYPDLYTNVDSWNYSADIKARDVTNLDLMSHETQLPDMSIAQRMETGWVRPEWVQTFDFSRSTIPLSQSITLHAVEDGAPPSGELTGVEIRIADGWNYYFEYRRTEAGQVGDQHLGSDTSTGNGAVVGTDVISQNFSFPINRPQVIRLRPDAEGEQSFFLPGQDYKEKDTSSMAVADFRMSVISANGNEAVIQIEYGTNGRPDLYIRPWPGGDNWQSPDIEIRNARSIADPGQWFNTPWEGHVNTVVAKYHNRGPITAQNVQVELFVKDYTVSNAPEVSLGTDTHDVPPESSTPTVEFSTQWLPGNQGHRCIIARTPLYIDTSVNPNIVEISDSNNEAQSNYTHYISASSSPGLRVRSTVALYNPFPQRALMYVVPQIHGSFAQYYRLYLEHQSLMLDSGETRYVEVMVESMFGDPRLNAEWERISEKLFRSPTNMTLAGYGIPPEAPQHPVLLGGAQITVSSAWATKFQNLEVSDVFVKGQVVSTHTKNGVPGHVLLTFHGPKETIANTITVPITQDGWFSSECLRYVKAFRAKELSLHYPGYPGFAACDPDKDRYPL